MRPYTFRAEIALSAQQEAELDALMDETNADMLSLSVRKDVGVVAVIEFRSDDEMAEVGKALVAALGNNKCISASFRSI